MVNTRVDRTATVVCASECVSTVIWVNVATAVAVFSVSTSCADSVAVAAPAATFCHCAINKDFIY